MGLLAATWGASYMFIKVGLRDFDAGTIVCGRTALAALVLIPVALRRDAFAALRSRPGVVVVNAVVQVALPFLAITVGERWIPSALAGILVASAPIFTALIAIRVDHEERATGLGLVGILVGMLGVGLLFGVDLSGDAKELAGGGLILLASVGYAIGPMLVKHRLRGAQPAGVAAATMAVSAVLTAPLVAIDPPGSIGWDSAGSLLALGIIGTGVAFLIFYTLIAELGPARASVVAYLAPGFSVLYGAAVLDESITVATIGGLVLILAGSYLGAERRLPGGPSRSAPSRSTEPEPVRAR
jgi:drug/metabolite transporter (DMT)-like permease